MQRLVHDLVSGAKVVFVTGAGLSVASGIAPYRGTPNAIWSNFITEWGTREKFLEDPKAWWNEFWLRTHETPQFLTAKPNAGHVAIASLSKVCHVRVMYAAFGYFSCSSTYNFAVRRTLIDFIFVLRCVRSIWQKFTAVWGVTNGMKSPRS